MQELNMNKLKLDYIVEQYSEELREHGITHIEGFKNRVLYFNDKLEKLANECNISSVQYLNVLDSNWRELYEFNEMYFYTCIIRQMNINIADETETKILN